MKRVKLVENSGYTTFSHALARGRFVATGGVTRHGRPRGEHRWRAGDRASVHLDVPGLAWTLVEVELVAVSEDLPPWKQSYGAVVRRFDGVATTLGGLRLGNKLVVRPGQFFALWAPEEEREDGEGSQKVYAEGSMRPPPQPRR